MRAATPLSAFVLHSRRYRDSSLIVELLARDLGRVACVAKGALRARRSDARIQPFQPVQVELRGRGEVQTLTRIEPLDVPLLLAGRTLYCGLYLNELLIRLTARQDPHPLLFDDYAAAIRELDADSMVEPVLRRFEMRLLSHLGLRPALENDVHGDPVVGDRLYLYDVASGPRPVTGNRAGAVSGSTLLALQQGSFADKATLVQARQLMRLIIDYHLDGRPLRSRELFR